MPGTWDHAMTWVDCQFPVGDETYLYYGGYARGHKVERFTERQIGLARMKRDRYVAREAGKTPGTLRTPLLTLDGSTLTLNAEARGGEVKAQVLDSAGKPMPGFTFADCTPIRSDASLSRCASSPESAYASTAAPTPRCVKRPNFFTSFGESACVSGSLAAPRGLSGDGNARTGS